MNNNYLYFFILLGIFTDYMDGYYVRKYKLWSDILPQLDIFADCLLMESSIITLSTKIGYSTNLYNYLYISSLLIWFLLDLILWKKFMGYHTYLAKLHGLLCCIFVLSMFFNILLFSANILVILGIIVNMEGILISVTTKKYLTCIKSIFHLF